MTPWPVLYYKVSLNLMGHLLDLETPGLWEACAVTAQRGERALILLGKLESFLEEGAL